MATGRGRLGAPVRLPLVARSRLIMPKPSPIAQLIAICATEGQKDSATANEARAKQWLEAAVALLPFASWGDAKAQKVRPLPFRSPGRQTVR